LGKDPFHEEATHHYGNARLQLSQAQRDRINLYLNFDMFGSPNYVFFIYDGDNSDGVGFPGGSGGSAQIEQTFERYFNIVGIPFKGTDFTSRSDDGPFIAIGIPSGGLFTGAEGVKTAAEAAIWGGTAGQQDDPCYHLACDTFANNSNTALDQMSDAVAHAVLLFSKRDFEKQPLASPVVPVSTGSGTSGGFHDHADESEPR